MFALGERALGRHPERAGNLHQHRECLFYRDGGFRLAEGNQLLLTTRAGTLTLKLKSPPGFVVDRLRVYRWQKDGNFYGTFSPAAAKPVTATGAKPSCIDDELPLDQEEDVDPAGRAAVAGLQPSSFKSLSETMRELDRVQPLT